jgi:hypothetical protein
LQLSIPAAIAAIMKEMVTAGPAFRPAAKPESTKIPVPKMIFSNWEKKNRILLTNDGTNTNKNQLERVECTF